MPSWLTMLFAIASGLLAANVYYSQPIAELIATSLGLSPSATGLIVAFTQAGFGIGLFLIVPLGDLMENRRLILACALDHRIINCADSVSRFGTSGRAGICRCTGHYPICGPYGP